MKSSIFRKTVLIILVFVILFITRIAYRSVAAITGEEAQTNIYLDMVYDNKSADSVIAKYHDTLNDIFNKKIKKVVEKMSKEPYVDKLLKIVSPPGFTKDRPGVRELCEVEGENENLSTYCLAQFSVQEYLNFRTAMLALRDTQQASAVEKFEKLGGKKEKAPEAAFEQRTFSGVVKDALRGQKSIQAYGAAINQIDREIEVSKQTLDLALATYNEMQLALPLHRKYMDIIKSLETYRNKVSAIRKKLDLYPPTFLDVTSAACT